MKFNINIPKELSELLENQYKEYIKTTTMTKKEQRALREWVKDGHSVYENSSCAWYDGQVPIPFLDIYREEENLRQQTKGMNSEEAKKYAMAYYGWNDTESNEMVPDEVEESISLSLMESDDDLPFK